MKPLSSNELEKYKKTYFPDFFCSLKVLDLQKYFEPFHDDEYYLQPTYKNGYWLLHQYKEILSKLDGDESNEFTVLLFDRYSEDFNFISFMHAYKKFFDGCNGLKGDDLLNFYDGYHQKGVLVYQLSSFRFNEEQILKHFCFWLKKCGVFNKILVCGETEKQKNVCREYVNAYFNRHSPFDLKKNQVLTKNSNFISALFFYCKNIFK